MSVTHHQQFVEIREQGVPALGVSSDRADNVIRRDGLVFKDADGSGELHPYKDWRKEPATRAADLATRLSIREISALMLVSSHQTVVAGHNRYASLFGPNTYAGKPLSESEALHTDLTDRQRDAVANGQRHFLLASADSPADAATWANNMQAQSEGTGFGLPVLISSDPRHGVKATAEYDVGAGQGTSRWPEPIGLAAAFDPGLVSSFGRTVQSEYRAMGIRMALSPQADLATEPRWSRFSGTFGENPDLVTALTQAYIDGLQSTESNGNDEGWGPCSVNAMVKHWPGGATGEAGRDAHYAYGKYAVYPGDNLADHLKPFLDGAFRLTGRTSKVAAVMPYYTISVGLDPERDVANAFSRHLIHTMLRREAGYDGVVCSDWLVIEDAGKTAGTFAGKPWGLETHSRETRVLQAIEAGVDQFGGADDISPILTAHEHFAAAHGADLARKRWEESARRILTTIFQVGLFENPYRDPRKTAQTVGNSTFLDLGRAAQTRSLVLLKNRSQVLPLAPRTRVFVPEQITPGSVDWFGNRNPAKHEPPLGRAAVGRRFELVTTPEDADVVLTVLRSPRTKGYQETAAGGAYLPISLQYRSYQASSARDAPIAPSDLSEAVPNRSYRGVASVPHNESDLDTVLTLRAQYPNLPIVAVVHSGNPVVVAEFETSVDALIWHAGVEQDVLLELLAGDSEPSGRLPFQIPASMESVETQREDVPHDMTCHRDDENNEYDFGFGLSWHGQLEEPPTFSNPRDTSN